jgi:transposase-like protein
MVRPDRELLSGLVELDETFVGGRTPGGGGSATLKVPVMVAVERRGGDRRLGRIRLAVGTSGGALTTVAFAERVIARGSTIRTDGARAYRRLATMGFTHEFGVGLLDPGYAEESMPGVHLVASLLKRWVAGTLHQGIGSDQLPYYLDEFTFRFNRRAAKSRGLLFYRLLQQAVATEPHPLDSLRISSGP